MNTMHIFDDSNKFQLHRPDFVLSDFRRRLADCIKWIYRNDLSPGERKFAFLAKRFLGLLLNWANGEDLTKEYVPLLMKVSQYMDSNSGFMTVSDPAGKWIGSLAIFRSKIAIHAETLVSYNNNLRAIGDFSNKKFDRPTLHDRCKRCQRIIHVTRRKSAFCSKACYQEYKGKQYFRKKARISYQVRKRRTSSQTTRKR